MVAHRLWMILSGRIPLDSDEGIVGIMTAQILQGQFFAFFRGQDYLGSLQSWLGLPATIILGPGAWAVRLTTLAQGVAIILLWHSILTRVGAPQAALWFALLLAVPPEFVATFLVKSRGQIEVVFLGSIILAVLMRADPERAGWRTWLGLGGLAGMGWWTSQLVIFYLFPALIFLLMDAAWRRALVGWATPASGRVLRFLLTTLLMFSFLALIARPSIYYQSTLSQALFQVRYGLLGMFVLVLLAFWRFAKPLGLPLWTAQSTLGFALAYSPALWIYGTKSVVYNTTSVIDPSEFFTNAWIMLLQLMGSTIGILSPTLSPWPLGTTGFVAVPGLYLFCVIILVRGAADRTNPANRAAQLAILLAGFAFPLWVVIQKGFHMVSHYGLTPTFFLLLVVALGLEYLGRLHRAFPWIVLAPLLLVNICSAVWLPRERLDPRTLTPSADAELLRFVRAQNVEVAATSLASRNQGYWDAYRLTLLSGMRLRIHPVTHMPRIVQFRDELRAASSTVLIVLPTEAEEVRRQFKQSEISFEERTFSNNLTVVHGFSKAKAEMMALFDYRMNRAE